MSLGLNATLGGDIANTKFEGWNGENTDETVKEFIGKHARLTEIDISVISVKTMGGTSDMVTGTEDNNNIDLVRLRFSALKGLCFQGIVSKALVENQMSNFGRLMLIVNFPVRLDLDLFFVDQNKLSRMSFEEAANLRTRNKSDTERYNFYQFDIILTCRQLEPTDPDVNCARYGGPGEEFESFADCMDVRTNRTIEFLGCTLPWFTDSEAEVCRKDSPGITNLLEGNVENFKKYFKTIENGALNSFTNLCSPPCTSVSVESKKTVENIVPSADSKPELMSIVLNFKSSVATTVFKRKTSAFDCINSFGSSLGLWLGISIFSIFQSLSGFSREESPRCIILNIIGLAIVIVSIGTFVLSQIS